jgi:hypothetical protein
MVEVRAQRQKEDDAKGALVLLTKEWNDTPHVQKYAAYGFLVLSWFATVSFTQHSWRIARERKVHLHQLCILLPQLKSKTHRLCPTKSLTSLTPLFLV